MAKTKNDTYRLIYIPEEARAFIGVNSKVFEKRFKTKQEAK
ncbi:hypothetical protein [Helcococcus bovis]